jgi:dynein heavy chain
MGADSVTFSSDVPPASVTSKKRCVLILRARALEESGPLTNANIDKEVLFMEFYKNTLEGINLVCNEVFMPVLGNPLNMIGWSDLVSKDLMDKFHVFLAYTSVTLGHALGSTVLPLPPTDITSSEKTSSKDKS